MMARSQPSHGKCAFCGVGVTDSNVTRHLQTCSARQSAIQKADRDRRQQRLYHLLITAANSPLYWLHLEMNGAASLATLDHYLRAIWVECCGHLSQFSIGASRAGNEVVMGTEADRVLSRTDRLSYVYDFGTETQLEIRVEDGREGQPLTDHPIHLMARNDPPPLACGVCGEPATTLCSFCWDEGQDTWALCDAHAEAHLEGHPDHEDSYCAVVNSPRMGLCRYNGPAEPPY